MTIHNMKDLKSTLKIQRRLIDKAVQMELCWRQRQRQLHIKPGLPFSLAVQRILQVHMGVR